MDTSLIEQLPNIAVFTQIVECNSLQAAATQLKLSRSVVSKKLAQLEQYLGERLIQHTTRKLSLTEFGERFYHQTQSLCGFVDDVQALKNNQESIPAGELTVSCSTAFGRRYLLPLLPIFHQQYPKIQLSLQIEDRIVDLISEQIDLAIRIGHLPDSSLVAQRMGEMRWALVASPAYLTEMGEPQDPADLSNHRCLTYRNAHSHMNTWQLTDKRGETQTLHMNAVLSVNDGDALIELAVAGAGLLFIDRALVAQQISLGLLKVILTDYQLPEGLPIYAVYPSRKGIPLKTRVLIDFLMVRVVPLL